MQLTRRGWSVAGCGLTLVAGTFLFAAPELLYGVTGLAAVVLGSQFAFVRALARTREELTVEITTDPERPSVEESVEVSVSVERNAAPLPARIVLPLPAPVVRDEPISLDLALKERMTLATPIESAVAGCYELGPVRVVATDRLGLFVGTFELDGAATIDVRSRTSPDMYVGRGNRRAAAAFGEHEGEYASAGIEPGQVRPYQSGESMRHIDWKATARLDEVYVVDPEAMTDRQTVLLVDNRAGMGLGQTPTRPFEYAKHVALSVVETARNLGDPVGLYAIGDEGVMAADNPRAATRQYHRIVERLQTLEPTGSPGRNVTPGASRTSIRARSGTSMAKATNAAARLTGDESQFATTVEPYLADATQYVHRVDDDPLLSTARTYLPQLRGTLWTVIITDDTGREEIRNTVDVARRNNNHVLVVLTPSVLFESDGITDSDRAYREYADFESFRQSLNSIARVEALEVAPGDRVETLLTDEEAGR